MNELKRIVENIETVFADSSYPSDFLAAYDQMECLASHSGRETFLVRKKENGEIAVAKCYDRAVFPFHFHPELLQGIDHPGLPRFFEQYQNDQILCVVREYVEGEPLNEYVKEQQLSTQQIVSFGEQLCNILSVLHGRTPPVIHRDIKPENIIVKPDDTLALIDFDISRAYKENAGSDTMCFGTRGYAPPEQYGFGQTDNRTDIYALGVLLRWLVTGSTKENANVTINARLQRIIDRCTAFSPEERYHDAAEVKQDLCKVQNGRRPVSVGKLLIGAVLLFCAFACGFALGRYTDILRPVPKIVFSEPLMERAVRLQLGKESGVLTEEDLSRVSRIYIYGSEAYGDPDLFYQQDISRHAEGPMRTLDDLKLLRNLEEVHIVRQGYLDVSSIAELPRLYTVEIKHSRISSVQPIAHLARLRYAGLFDCGVTDVTALENCPWLETLDIGHNDLKELSQVGYHPSLRSANLMWLNMKNVDDIAQRLPKLRTVYLQHSDIRDLSGLKALHDLEKVYVLQEQLDAVSGLFAGTDVEIHVTEN